MKTNERLIQGNFDVVTSDNIKQKAHDLVDIDYFPESVIELQKELMHPFHNGLFIRLITKYPDEMQSLQSQEAFLTLLCTDLEIQLDGEYTMEQLCSKVYDRISTERKLSYLQVH